jgi:ABC-type multidrug transport system fused ATPase/permease subunit
MSLVKPILDYVKALKPKRNFSQTVSVFKRLMSYHRKYIGFISLTFAVSIIRSYLSVLEPFYTALIINNVIIAGNTTLLSGYLMTILFAGTGFAICSVVLMVLNGVMSQYIIRDIRTDYYSSIQGKSFSFYDSNPVGDLISRATMDLQFVDTFTKTWLVTLLNAVFTFIATFWIIISISPAMSVIVLVTLPLIFYFTTRLFVETMPLFRVMQLILGKLSAYIQQNIIGMKTIRIFRREKDVVEGFEEVEAIYVRTAIEAGRKQAIFLPLSSSILTLGIVFIYVYAGFSLTIPGSTLLIGDIILFARYMIRLAFPLREFGTTLGTWIMASSGLERVFDVMDVPKIVKDRPGARQVNIEKGKVEFRDVTFGYVKDRPMLKDVSFIAEPGESIAVLGATGSGKSSLIYLIPRFYDVTSGSVAIDGVDVREFKLSSLRRQIGVILQDVLLFSGTIKENIAFAKPDATMDEVVTAAKMARIHEFIESLPAGYETLVGERGVTLSGGQKQRLTIARALLINPKILIMDDSLSFVDAKTEQEIQFAIQEAARTRTTLIIAQRFSTIKNADKLMVLDNGTIVEFGTHVELLAKDGFYKRIYETQFLEKSLAET